jgi:hypothetical protein
MPGVDDGIVFPAEKLRTWTQLVLERVGVSQGSGGLGQVRQVVLASSPPCPADPAGSGSGF